MVTCTRSFGPEPTRQRRGPITDSETLSHDHQRGAPNVGTNPRPGPWFPHNETSSIAASVTAGITGGRWSA